MITEKEFLKAANGDLELVKQYIQKGGSINAKDNNGYTALMHASWNGHTESVKYLIGASADINAKDNNGDTAFIWASKYGHTEVAEYIKNSNEILLRKKLDIKNASDVIKDSCIF